MTSSPKEVTPIRLTVHLQPPKTRQRKQMETELDITRTKLREWLQSIDAKASVIPDRNVPSACSIAYVVTSSRWAALKTVALPLTWHSHVRKVEFTKEHSPLGVGDVIEPLRK